MFLATVHRVLFAVISTGLLAPAAMQADVISNFSASSEGWTSGGVCSFNGAAGNPAGDLDCGTQTAVPLLSAPAKFLGNDSAAYGNTFSFDVFNRLSVVSLTLDLIGNGQGIQFAIGGIGPSFSWKHETIPLTASGWTALNSNARPSATAFQSILGNLSAIQLVTSIPVFSDLAFDNFNLGGVTATPEPGTLSLLTLTAMLAGIAVIGRRRADERAIGAGRPIYNDADGQLSITVRVSSSPRS